MQTNVEEHGGKHTSLMEAVTAALDKTATDVCTLSMSIEVPPAIAI